MDDGSRCLLDVIDDPQLLQSFLENTNIERLEAGVTNIDSPSHKTLAAVKQMEANSATLAAITLVAESKQVDQVTSSGGNSSPLLSMNKATNQVIFDDKQMINMVSSSVGLIPISAFSSAVTAQSISIAQPSLTTLTTSGVPLRAPAPPWPPTSFQFTGSRNPVTVQLPQQLIVPTGAMPMTAPGLQQLLLTTPRPGAPQPHLAGGIQPGQLVQIIQTPNGTQILPTNPSPAVQPIVSSNATAKSSSAPLTSRSNKQILPKPPGSGVSTTNAVTTNSANKCGQIAQQNSLKVINSLTPNVTQTGTTSAPTTQQILLGPGGQPAGVLAAGPNGTFVLNPFAGIGSQQILIQPNLANVPNSVQLTLRPPSHGSSMVAMSNGLTTSNITSSITTDQNNGLLNALTAQTPSVAKQTPSQSPQPQTFVIPNSTAVSSASPGVVMTNAGRAASNIIFTRPPSLIGAHHQSPPTVPTGQQFLQIQTPNGPVLVQIPAQPQIIPQPQASNATVNTQPTHGIQLGNTMIPFGPSHLTGAHPALHALLTHTDSSNGQAMLQTSVATNQATSNTVIFTSQPQIIATRPQLPQQSKPSVNLAELLKEHGILPESSPPSSPTNNANSDSTSGGIPSELMSAPLSQPTVLMVPNGPNQPPNIVLAQSAVTPTTPPQLRLALGPDGSVILQQNIPTNAIQQQIQSQFISNSNNLKYSDPLKDSGLGSSQPSPDSTTPTIDSTTTTSSTTITTTSTSTSTMSATPVSCQNTSALLEQLSTGPAVKVPDIVASLALSSGSTTASEESKPITSQTALIPLTVQNINNSLEQQKQTVLTIPVQSRDTTVSNGSSNAVIRIGSCDSIPTSLVLTTTPTTVFTSPPKTRTADSSIGSNAPNTVTNASVNGTAVIDQNGVPMVQVSPNNQEFLQRLESQIKNLSALKSPNDQEKELLKELLSLQHKMNQARHIQSNASLDSKAVPSTAASISVSQQTQQLLQSAGQTTAQPQQSQQSLASAESQQTPQNVHLVNLLKQTPVNQSSSQLRLVTSASTTPVSATATIQVGNQLITFTTPAKQQLQNLKSMANNQTPQTVLKVF